MNNLMKFAFALGILMACGGVFYHYVIYLPSLEDRKDGRVEKVIRSDTNNTQTNRFDYESCKSNAQLSYQANWASACALQEEGIRQQNIALCLRNKTIMTTPGYGGDYCLRKFGTVTSNSNCALPPQHSNRINNMLSEAQNRCLVEARSGL
jgi:hypothetical protein